MPWLCYVKHNWFFIDGTRRRMCLRGKRYQTLWSAHYGHDASWEDDAR